MNPIMISMLWRGNTDLNERSRHGLIQFKRRTDHFSFGSQSRNQRRFYESDEADGFDLANAVMLAKKDLFPGEDKGKVIVVKNDDGSYLTLNNKILAIDNIDDRNIDNIAIVAKKWYDSALKKIELLKEAPVGSLPEEEVSGEE